MRSAKISTIPWKEISWVNTLFLLGTLFLTATAVPFYLWKFGLNWFQVGLFFAFYAATGLSITLGYHRLYSHLSFKASWPVRLFTLLFGAAAFENSALAWTADHRRHHKHTDHEEDPYDISKGFFYAHMGWVMLKGDRGVLENVGDLQRDRWVVWQHRFYLPLAIGVGFLLPGLIGWMWGGWEQALGGFLLAGVARSVLVQQMTFFINSLCHTLGRQTYSTRCTARDSALMAVFTFGEGYHNFHHEFQHDYRNGVKPWQFDPTKWAIYALSKLGLASGLRRVPDHRILAAELEEERRKLERELAESPTRLAESAQAIWLSAQERVREAMRRWDQFKADYSRKVEEQFDHSRRRSRELRRDFQEAANQFRAAIQDWRETAQRLLQEQSA